MRKTVNVLNKLPKSIQLKTEAKCYKTCHADNQNDIDPLTQFFKITWKKLTVKPHLEKTVDAYP